MQGKNLRDTATFSPDEVTQFMMEKGYVLQREDDRLVWCTNFIQHFDPD